MFLSSFKEQEPKFPRNESTVQTSGRLLFAGSCSFQKPMPSTVMSLTVFEFTMQHSFIGFHLTYCMQMHDRRLETPFSQN
jgi:hypothetical protein